MTMPTDSTRDPHGGFVDGNGVSVVPGDRVECRFDARRGRLIEVFNDGDAYVRFDGNACFKVVKWCHLCKVPAWAENPTRDPYAEGVEAHGRGLGWPKNPYDPTRQFGQHVRWLDGWTNAALDSLASNPDAMETPDA